MGIKMQKKIAAKDAYMTLEATLIMPLVLYICIFIIYMGFYIYDRCIMKQDAYRAALKGSSQYVADNQEVYNEVYRSMENLKQDKYIATECNYEITVRERVMVSVKGCIKMPFRGIAQITGGGEWKIEEKAESRCINPVVFIRLCRDLEQMKNNKKEQE